MSNIRYPKTKGLALSATFAVILSLFSLVSIPLYPFTPVPLTLQVFGVFLIAALLGPYYGALSCLIYLVLGALGLPVFAGGSFGASTLFGPFGGFLFSFPIAAFVGGAVSRNVSRTRKGDILRVAFDFAVSLAIIYPLGSLWLKEYFHFTILQAFAAGSVPFVAFDILKAIVATPIAVRLRATRMNLPVNRFARYLNSLATNEIPKN
jgi:biotin transport system substrate-specific component